jgi:hypothetical protein
MPHSQPKLTLVNYQGKAEEVNNNVLLITVEPPATTSASARTSSHIVLVIDVSGSMGTSSTSGSNASGSPSESSALSVLDVTKHAAKTVINQLGAADFLSIVTYHDVSAVILEGISMSAASKARAISLVDGLRPLNSTNLWSGLETSMNVIKKFQEKSADKVSKTKYDERPFTFAFVFD